MDHTYSIKQVNLHLKKVINNAFPKRIWVDARISNPKISRGHTYLTLLDNEDQGFQTAKASSILWAQDRIKLNSVHGTQLVNDLLSDDVGIRLLIEVTFHVSYGLSLHIKDIDPATTLGKLEIKHKEILKILTKENRLEKNSLVKLPQVIQRIAVISSKNAAGYIDFANHLRNNQHGYQYQLDLYESSMQGVNTERDVEAALTEISERESEYHVIVIVRGGGSKLDLASFDNLVIGRLISDMEIPVISGIGHEIDATIVDRVAHSYKKTPTAVSEFINQHNRFFEENVIFFTDQIQVLIEDRIKEQDQFLSQFSTLLQTIINHRLRNENAMILNIKNNLRLNIINQIESNIINLSAVKKRLQLSKDNLLNSESEKLLYLIKIFDQYDPKNVLKLGYSITRQNGKALKSTEELNPDSPIETQLYNGKIISDVTKQ